MIPHLNRVQILMIALFNFYLHSTLAKTGTAVEMASKWSPIPYFGGHNYEQRFSSLLAVNIEILRKFNFFDEPLQRY